MNFKLNLAVVIVFSYFISSCNSERQPASVLDSLSQQLAEGRIQLPNGWSLSPAGKTIPLGDFPMNLVLSPSGKFMAATNNGHGRQTITLIDPVSEKIFDEVEIKKSWYGLVFNKAETRLYASGGNDNMIVVYEINNARLEKIDSIVLGKPWPVRISPAGITLDDEAGTLFVATKEDNALYIVDLTTKRSKRLPLGKEAYACLLSPDRKSLYVSLWGGDKVAVIDPVKVKIESTIAVGSNPNEMVLTKDGKYLFVAHANDNGVSVIQTSASRVIEVFNTALFPDSLAGSTPNALTLSADEKKLYVANADNNCLAVFDVSEPGDGKSLGFIPTGWYPTSVKVLNNKIWVTNGKGGRSMANPKGPNPYKPRTDETEYIGELFKGTLSIVSEPDVETLALYSRAVYMNTPYSREIAAVADGEAGNPIPRKAGEVSPIKHVFYIIKENRTYDQVLGDMPKGNGDSTLCLFPQRVTPNQHALANNFVLLDNFYVNAEVSADGHNWSMAAYANDYVEKVWPTSYSDRGGTYDYEGTREITFPKYGFIWDYCNRAGVSYRTYGEFIHGGNATVSSLEGHFDNDFPEYDLTVSDLTRFERWKYDFDSLLAIDAVPQLSTIRLPNNHTAGARVGMPTPRAMVAENDQALGKLIEHLSHSKIWKESAVFVLEDDAQNGPDHVDAHRSPAQVISPYARRNAVVSRMYSTASVLRTIELILGLPPMSQYDAAATPMWECFTDKPDVRAFQAVPAQYNLKEMNTKVSSISRQSDEFNLEMVDAAPDLAFSEVIWKAVKGLDSEMPAPVRSAFIKPFDEAEGE
ncbi:MAG: bifunctional YncE family protein/alkaline phosphatase family protein [Cyclobacteriaceae bacterium]|nr:bifunctional YncE family protein/alkaline phosphatase family protein [Cyclobacteriaceae bacterium]MDH5250986.1 bifunctional YncE family protein/alkaline phosphatase family protein [Cyclobacteriaceae bacterium]